MCIANLLLEKKLNTMAMITAGSKADEESLWAAGEWSRAGLVIHGAAMWLGPCLKVVHPAFFLWFTEIASDC